MGEFFAGLGALFVIGTVSFWVVSALAFILLTILTENERDIIAFVCVAGFIFVLSSVNDISVALNPLLWLKWLAIYLVIGCLWSFIKWFSFLHKAKDRLKEIKQKYIDRFGKEKLIRPDGKIKNFAEFWKFCRESAYYTDFLSIQGNSMVIAEPNDLIPTVEGRFSQLVRWITWWPMSAIWTILNDPLKRIAEALVRLLKTIYTKIAVAVFKGI